MKTCRECFHYTPCWKATSVAVRQNVEKNEIVQYCEDFCERSRVMQLCVGMGEDVWVIAGGEAMEAIVVEVEAELTMNSDESAYTAESNSGYHYFNNDDIGDTVFLSREAAEAVLAMRKERETK